MKKNILILTLLVIVVAVILAVTGMKTTNDDYLRIHIRANSNSEVDQDVKYMVKGEIVKLLSPRLSGVKSVEDAKDIVKSSIDDINDVANSVLIAQNLPYRASCTIRREKFPLRHYGNLTLEEGVYEALIVNLGKADGDNWWCVVFPPLCFVPSEEVGSGDFEYVSKIEEIIDKWR